MFCNRLADVSLLFSTAVAALAVCLLSLLAAIAIANELFDAQSDAIGFEFVLDLLLLIAIGSDVVVVCDNLLLRLQF